MERTTPPQEIIMSDQLKRAIRHMVDNISKSFIVEWYTSISPTNHDFVVSCETLIETALTKLATICLQKLDKYKIGQLVTSLLHDHILNDTIPEKVQSIKNQIENHEYDICQNSVVRLFGLLCTEELRQVIFTQDYNPPTTTTTSPPSYGSSSSRASQQTDLETDNGQQATRTETTSALYTLVIAMLTKAVFMPIVGSISEPNWLYAVIIWLCKKEEREKARREESKRKSMETLATLNIQQNQNQNQHQHSAGSNTTSSKFYGQEFMSSNETKMNLISQNPKITVTSTTRGYRSVDVEEGIDMASGNINFENPVCDSLKRPLDNIEIHATEEVKSNNSCYILYCIRYEGICHKHPSTGGYGGFNFIPENSELPIIDKRATANTRLMSHEPSSSSASGRRNTNNATDSSGRKTFRRTMTIKRRFREFVILQLRLEENPKIRPYMKNIPKPTKLKAATQSIFSLPGITNIKLDQSTIRLRQRFLERFLIALNNSPFIANSYEFKEFFSYNLNSATINMNKSKSLILQVNFNKVLVDSVRSALSIIRSTMPTEDVSNLGCSNSNPDAWLIELQQRTLKLHVQTRTSHSKMNLERYIDSKLLLLSDGSSSQYGASSHLGSRTNYETDEFNPFTYSRDSRSIPASASMNSMPLSGGGDGVQHKRLVKSHSTQSSQANTYSSPLFVSRSSSSNSPQPLESGSRSTSSESIYHDASSFLAHNSTSSKNDGDLQQHQSCNSNSSIKQQPQVCESVPIASKLIDIMHYSISKDSTCSNSSINFMARMALGKMIERHAVRLLEATLTLENATLCLDGITSSIWGESDDPPLDMENASLDEAVKHLTKLVEENYVNYSFIPKRLLNLLVSKQIRFYLTQLVSQERNKFVIYSFFVHLLDELEI